MDKELNELMKDYYDDFLCKTVNPILSNVIVKNSFPIVWFGNMEMYFNSDVKVITIGLNPSNQEFPENNPDKRFPKARISYQNGAYKNVEDDLNNYFNNEPYDWFKSYERVLSYFSFGVTYGGKINRYIKAKNYALHIDFFSGIATNPTYGKLKTMQKKALQRIDLFQRLYNYLNPNIVLFSTSKQEIKESFKLNSIQFNLRNKIELYNINDKFFIWGKPNIKPFQGVKENELINGFQQINLRLCSLNKLKKKEGVFWVIGQSKTAIIEGKFKIIYKFDNKRSHSEIWKEIVTEHNELSHFDYETFPRGRVWETETKPIVFLNKEINVPSVLQKIDEVFALDGNYEVQVDE